MSGHNILNRIHVAKELCEAVGLDPTKVLSLTIHVPSGNEWPYITADILFVNETADKLAQVIEKYEIVKVD